MYVLTLPSIDIVFLPILFKVKRTKFGTTYFD